MKHSRIVITGVGFTAPNGNSLPEFRQNLLNGVAGIKRIEIRYMGLAARGRLPLRSAEVSEEEGSPRRDAGRQHQHLLRPRSAGGQRVNSDAVPKDRIGIYIGCTEHGNVETENEIYNISKFNYDTKFWSHYHNPRTVANNPAGETSLNLGVTGPSYTIGAACAAGNMGLIHATQMLRLGEVDFAICGGVSESIHTFGIFAGFKSQNALATHEDPKKASRPFDKARNGIVISEGGGLYTLERLEDAQARGAKIYGEIAGYHVNSATRATTCCRIRTRQAECVRACAGNGPSFAQ